MAVAARRLSDAFYSIDVILKAAQSLVSRVCVTIALYHIKCSHIQRHLYDVYHVLLTVTLCAGAFRFEAFEFVIRNELRGKFTRNGKLLTYSIRTYIYINTYKYNIVMDLLASRHTSLSLAR